MVDETIGRSVGEGDLDIMADQKDQPGNSISDNRHSFAAIHFKERVETVLSVELASSRRTVGMRYSLSDWILQTESARKLPPDISLVRDTANI
jgi:hypothetical protein